MVQQFNVEGMHCDGCAARVKRIIEAKAAGARAEVDLAKGRVVVDGAVGDLDIAALITAAGYPATSAP